MPEIGEIRKERSASFIWHACIDCGKERWVRFYAGEPRNLRCSHCAAVKYHGYNERINDGKGYMMVKLQPDDFFYPMVKKNGYVLEHRLAMAKALGRCLQFWELVHHKSGNRQDNRIESLELTTNGAHTIAHNKGYKDGYAKGLMEGKDKQITDLQKRVTLLEAEIILLKTGECEKNKSRITELLKG